MVIAIGILVSLLLSAIFSGSEIAFISSSKLKVELKKKSGTRRGLILAKFFENPADFLSTMLVGNNVALVIFTTLMTGVLVNIFPESLNSSEYLQLLASTIIITLVVLVFGEFLPKTLFRLFSDDILYALAYPLRFLKSILSFPSWLMFTTSNKIISQFVKLPDEEDAETFTRTDLEDFIKSSRSDDDDEEVDTELFEKALKLRETRLRDCMIPRTEIQHIDITSTMDELEGLISATKLSRILISKDDIENVQGYIHHQQLFKNPKSIKTILLPIEYLPEAMRVKDAMDVFIKNRMSIACIVDEFGSISGIVTTEDLVEEIFGEIDDEHDVEDLIDFQLSEDEYLFSGRMEIDQLNDKYDLNLPEGEYQTLSGYLVMTSGDIPEQDSEIVLGNYRFVLEQVSNTKIETIRVHKLPAEN